MTDKCSICLELFDENTNDPGKMRYTLPCNNNHQFHVDCIMTNFRMGNASCPLCRDIPENCKPVNEMAELEQMESIARLHWKKHNDMRNRYARKNEDVRDVREKYWNKRKEVRKMVKEYDKSMQKSMKQAFRAVTAQYRTEKNKLSREMEKLYQLDRKFDQIVEEKRR